MKNSPLRVLGVLCVLCISAFSQARRELPLPSSKILLTPAPGAPQRTNSLPLTMAVSPDGKYLVLLNNGFGVAESGGQQSIAVLEIASNRITDFPDARFVRSAHQTYFLGLAFSGDGRHLYASVASLSDPDGRAGGTGNGIAVYAFDSGRVTPERFLSIPLQTLAADRRSNKLWSKLPDGKGIPYPAGLAVLNGQGGEKLLVADNLSDDALLLDASSGKVLRRFDLSTGAHVPSVFPYGAVADGQRAWVSLWNASAVAELDLAAGGVARVIKLHAPSDTGRAGSHPTAMLLNPAAGVLFVTLSNTDEIAAVPLVQGLPVRYFSTRLPAQAYGGAYPNALAQTPDGKRLLVANAGSDAIAVFALGASGLPDPQSPIGFIPTEWYPTALAAAGNQLFIASGKGQSTGPNSGPLKPGDTSGRKHPYVASLLYGSLARLSLDDIGTAEKLRPLTAEVMRSNLMDGRTEQFPFAGGKNPIRHVIYVIKENRTYDQLFGDLQPGDGDPSLVLYGEDITPNQHRLARQFGILDNFYDSGEVSGDGHVWSTAAISSDYTEKTWQIGYRSRERTYDYEGAVANDVPLEQGIADVNEPGTGYLWTNLARHGMSYRHYGEYVTSKWCNQMVAQSSSPLEGTPSIAGTSCPRTFVRPGEALPDGKPNPYGWRIPILGFNQPTKPELRGHFDPNYADFRLDYPDQLRADEFLREFAQFVREGNLPQFITLRLPNDHTAGTRRDMPTPAAAVADNDLALGRVVDAVSHSSYWDSTAIFVLEDDAQDGADHVDAHRSIALVISKYAPRGGPSVDHHFYTTVNMIHTMEALLGLPPMNNNDARAAVMAPLFSGQGSQPPFVADSRNRDNGLIYRANAANARGAGQSAKMDFTHADAVDTRVLNRILWQDRRGKQPMPAPVHRVFQAGKPDKDDD